MPPRLHSPPESKSGSPEIRLRTIEALIAACKDVERLHQFRDAVQRPGDEKQTAAASADLALRRSASANGRSKGVSRDVGAAAPAENAQPLGRLAVAILVCIFVLCAFLAGIYIGATSSDWQRRARLPIATASLQAPANMVHDDHSASGTEVSVLASRLAKPLGPHSAVPATRAAGHMATKRKTASRSEPRTAAPLPKAADAVETHNHPRMAAEEQPLLAAGTLHLSPEGKSAANTPFEMDKPTAVEKTAASLPATGQTVAVATAPAPAGTAKHVQTPAKLPLAIRSPEPLKTDQQSEKPPASAGTTRATSKSASQTSRDTTAAAAAPKRSPPGSRSVQSAALDVVDPSKGSRTSLEKSPSAPSPKPSARAATASVARRLSINDWQAFLSRGDALLAAGDLTSARLFYQYGAAAGDGVAALRLGETFDPVFLRQAHLAAASSDAKEAAYWYRWARGLGNHDAEILLNKLDPTGK